MVSLTYDFNEGSDYNSTYVTNGTVNASDLSCYFHNQACPPPVSSGEQVKQGLAHSYGQLALSSDCGSYSHISEVLESKHNYDYFCRRIPGQHAFTHRFVEYNPHDAQRAYPRMTDRVITASSGPYLTYHEVDSKMETTRRNYTFTNNNGSVFWIDIPDAVEIPGSTSYVYKGFYSPETAEGQRCGPRCVWMWAHRNIGEGQSSTIYQRPISISNVTDVMSDEQIVPDNVAYLAAASIGINGRGDATSGWIQYQFSPFGCV